MDSSPDSLSLRLRRESSGSRDSFYVRAQGKKKPKIRVWLCNFCIFCFVGIDSDIEEAIDTSPPAPQPQHNSNNNEREIVNVNNEQSNNNAPSPVLPPIPSNLVEP